MAERGLRPWRAVLCSAGILGVAACGGVEELEQAAELPAAAPVAISQANANRVSTEALQAIAASLAGVRATEGSSAAATSRQAVVSRALSKAGSVRAQAVSQETFNCSGGGSVVVKLNAAAAGILSPGDTLDFAFSFCREAEIITNGALKLTLTTFDQAAGGGTLEVYDTVATNLEQTAGGVLERQNGAMSLAFDNRLIEPRLVGQVDITALSLTGSVERRINGVSKTKRDLQNLQLLRSDVPDTLRSVSFVSFIATGTFPQLNEASFRVDTVTAIVVPTGAFQPTSGEVKITGANNSNIIIRIGADTVLLEVDADGNGVAEANIQRNWSQVLAER